MVPRPKRVRSRGGRTVGGKKNKKKGQGTARQTRECKKPAYWSKRSGGKAATTFEPAKTEKELNDGDEDVRAQGVDSAAGGNPCRLKNRRIAIRVGKKSCRERRSTVKEGRASKR